MRSPRFNALLLILVCLVMARPLVAQRDKPEPLTEVQMEKIREAGIDPNTRVKLYTEFLGEHTDTIKGLSNRRDSPARTKRLDEELKSLSALMDELGSNLDTYSDRHADIRKALKPLAEAGDHWLTTLRALAGEPGFDLARKDAIEGCEDLADEARRLLTEQTEYFNLHKDEQGQERAEPK